jgi:hypothetical protein
MTPADQEAGRDLWHIDKKVPLAIVLAMLMQGASLIWWANGITKDNQEYARRISQLESQRADQRLTVLESQMIDSRGSLSRIEGKLDRLIETRGGR